MVESRGRMMLIQAFPNTDQSRLQISKDRCRNLQKKQEIAGVFRSCKINMSALKFEGGHFCNPYTTFSVNVIIVF